jgi:hypothetical protein
MRLELRIGREQRLTARAADVRAVVPDFEKRSRKRRFSAGLSQNAIAFWTKLLLPLLLAFLDFRRDVVLHFRSPAQHNEERRPSDAGIAGMKLLFEILLSVFLHPIAMILMWINLIARGDMTTFKKLVWFVVSILWGLGPILYILVAEGSLW